MSIVVVVGYGCFYPIPKVLQHTDFFLGLGKKLKNSSLNESALTRDFFFNFVIFKKFPNPFVGKTTKFVEK